ncbi:MAG: TIGR01777 family protein [Flavobacteriales bacterium]|nr:TIGR01777 family oxidoreductase [Flavobacteriales bacterium]MCB9191395.1 TIGR01777 family protein [Flavobacteriales bacterium]MCB9203980.1 TIGR01777 family protein [Flavobacteriales bacterium]
MVKILITGGSGSIGRYLIPRLLFNMYQVSIIGRTEKKIPRVESYTWNLEKEELDERALRGVTHIIHLAGAGIADKPWSPSRKKEIVESRVKPLQMLAKALSNRNQRIEAIISSSAVGYYGGLTSDTIFDETARSATDFLGSTCKMWEDAVQLFKPVADREVRIRTSVVLMNDAGALPQLVRPTKLGFGAAVGSGKQWMPWIHIDDLVELYVEAIINKNLHGAYNAAAPEHVDQTTMIKGIGKALERPTFLPPVPKFLMKTVLGEMSTVITEGSRVSSQKLIDTGFEFKFTELQQALNDLLK